MIGSIRPLQRETKFSTRPTYRVETGYMVHCLLCYKMLFSAYLVPTRIQSNKSAIDNANDWQLISDGLREAAVI